MVTKEKTDSECCRFCSREKRALVASKGPEGGIDWGRHFIPISIHEGLVVDDFAQVSTDSPSVFVDHIGRNDVIASESGAIHFGIKSIFEIE